MAESFETGLKWTVYNHANSAHVTAKMFIEKFGAGMDPDTLSRAKKLTAELKRDLQIAELSAFKLRREI